MSGFKPIYPGDEERLKLDRDANEIIGKTLGSLQNVAEYLTGMGDTERWELFKTCLNALVIAGDQMIAADPAIDSGDPKSDN